MRSRNLLRSFYLLILLSISLFIYLIIYLIMKQLDSLEKRVQLAIAIISSNHRIASQKDEEIESKKTDFRRLQNYVFCEDFCLITNSNDSKKARLLLQCKRHDKNTRDTRKLKKKDIRKRQTNVHATNCLYSIIIAQKAKSRK